MKFNLLLLATLPIAMYSQETYTKTTEELPNTFTSWSKNVRKFDNKSKLFSDWSIGVGGGAPFMVHSDIQSFHKGKVNWGWNAYIELEKQISHTFGIMFQYQLGKSTQQAFLREDYNVGNAYTKYHQVNVLGDLNLTNLMRRVDNESHYRWNLHAYAGIGLMSYKAEVLDQSKRWNNGRGPIHQDLDLASFFYQGGMGLKYKLNSRIDLEARAMYIISGDDEFDGGGWESDAIKTHSDGSPTPRAIDNPYNYIQKNTTDNMFIFNLGVGIKLGKSNNVDYRTHLAWYSPINRAYSVINQKANEPLNIEVCASGDKDNDGVCDDWDGQLDTPGGARVDGAGVALDTDLDGVIDRDDKCVTVPGAIDNAGCPIEKLEQKNTEVAKKNTDLLIQEINKEFEGIEFALNKDIIRPQSFGKLDNAAAIIKTLSPDSNYLVIGCTDTRASEKYNQILSQKRAAAVVKYLVDKGVSKSMLTPEGRGEKDLKYPECDPAEKCPEWKNEANRRVYFDIRK